MNTYLFIAGTLCFILGLVHSVLGEFLIFKNRRKQNNIVPTITTSYLKESHLRIIWATWHLASFFGWCIGAILLIIALNQTQASADFIQFITIKIAIAMFSSSFLVCLVTKGKHLGWVVLLSIGTLTLLDFLKSI